MLLAWEPHLRTTFLNDFLGLLATGSFHTYRFMQDLCPSIYSLENLEVLLQKGNTTNKVERMSEMSIMWPKQSSKTKGKAYQEPSTHPAQSLPIHTLMGHLLLCLVPLEHLPRQPPLTVFISLIISKMRPMWTWPTCLWGIACLHFKVLYIFKLT